MAVILNRKHVANSYVQNYWKVYQFELISTIGLKMKIFPLIVSVLISSANHSKISLIIWDVITSKPNTWFNSLLYLEDISEGLPGQLVVDDGEESAERPQEGGGLHTLPQQVLHCGQDVNFCLLE